MKISKEFPPNYEKIKESFDLSDKKPIFTYGNTIYNPHECSLPDHILTHELVHIKQQNDPESWWERYLTEPQFRLQEELEAYRKQYQFAKQWIKDRNTLSRFLIAISSELSSGLYGNIIKQSEAQKLIQQ